MQKINIQCPGCHKRFTLKAANPAALLNKPFVCPACGVSTPFSTLLNGPARRPAPAMHDLRTHIGGPVIAQASSRGQKTQVSKRPKLIVENTGNSVPLMPGIYTVGRASTDSTANIKLAADPYMSRQHARLIVNTTGGTTTCQIQGLTSVNTIFINDKKLPAGQIVNLANGDKILLGMTTVIYSI